MIGHIYVQDWTESSDGSGSNTENAGIRRAILRLWRPHSHHKPESTYMPPLNESRDSWARRSGRYDEWAAAYLLQSTVLAKNFARVLRALEQDLHTLRKPQTTLARAHGLELPPPLTAHSAFSLPSIAAVALANQIITPYLSPCRLEEDQGRATTLQHNGTQAQCIDIDGRSLRAQAQHK
jgi:hypothetical protein